MQLIQDLLDARSLITNGWCQHVGKSFVEGEGFAYCLVSAIEEVCQWPSPGSHTRFGEAVKALVVTMGHENLGQACCDDLPCSLITWNDDPQRTKEHVLELINRTIDRELN